MKEEYQRLTFDLEESHWWYRARKEIIVDCVQRILGDHPDARILDIGCGAGTILSSLARHYRAVGLDISPEAAERARARSGCNVLVGSIPGHVPAELCNLDAICLFDVIEHFDEDVGILRHARDLLRYGGYVFISVPAFQWLYGQHDRINGHRRRYSRSQLLSAIRTAGYDVVWCSYFNCLLSPLLIPAILWRGRKTTGHNFEVRSALDGVLESILRSETTLLRYVRFPIGLSLLAVGRK
jgi:SAM-dependent methyltransferase